MDPLASTRISLSWPPQPHAESEDVLVISGRSGIYLDLRTLRTTAPPQSGAADEATGSGPDPRVSWATAALKEVLPLEPGQEHPRACFTPMLDSRRPASSHPREDGGVSDSAPPDEGSFEPLPNGDVLEKGVMLRPETGLVSAYEEVWRRLPLTRTPRVVFLEHKRADGRETAYVGRVGDYELGMLDGEDGFAAVRREKRTDGDGEEQWETLFVSGDDAAQRLPSLAHVAPLEGETKIVLEGRTWRVIEAS